MASSRIKGITIEIGGDTTGLDKALQGINKDISLTQNELKDVNRLLKLDPKNTELLEQKQRLLREAISQTGEKLQTLRTAEKQAQEQFKKGEISRVQYDRLQREIAETERTEKDLEEQVKKTSSSLDKQDGSMRKNIISASLAADALKAVGKAVVSMAKDAVEYNAEMESYTAAFTSFLGDAQQAEEAIANIKADASGMTFGTDALIEANQMLITTGVGAEDAREAVNALAESIAATGGGDAELSRMASNLQQIRNVGKASSMDIRQFANAGINVYGLLSDYTGKSVEEIKDMEVSYDDLVKALKKATSEGGRYYGAMAKQAETYNGRLNALKSRIKDTLGQTFKSVSENLKNNVFPAINKALDKIDFDKLGESIGKIINVIGEILPTVLPVVARVINAIGRVIDALYPIVTALSGVLNSIMDMLDNAFAGKWKKAWEGLVNVVIGLWNTLLTTIGTIVNKIIDAVNTVISWFNGTPIPNITLPTVSLPTNGEVLNVGNKPSVGMSSPSTTNNNTNVGDIIVNVSNSNASANDIARAVEDTLTGKIKRGAYQYG